MDELGLVKASDSALLVIDYQESLTNLVFENEKMLSNANKVIKGAAILGVPTLVTEQYPKGLGHTCKEIELVEGQEVIEKISFSCILCKDVNDRLNRLNVRSLIIIGIEAHICVLKTALDAKKAGYEVHVISDAISSRTEENKKAAIRRMKQSGVFIASTEMILFQLMDKAGSEEFKAISRLVK